MNCRSCNAPIVWAITEKGRRMPVDAKPSAAGNLLLDHERGEWRAIVVKNDDTAAENELHTSHFATCPNAARHRNPK